MINIESLHIGGSPMENAQQPVAVTAGPAQLISKLCDEIGFEEIVNDLLPWDPSHCKLSPGARLKALVINILCDRQPLYQIEEFFEDQDVALLFGDDVRAADFKDDTLARGLDKLSEAEPWKVYSTLALSALRVLNLTIDVLHNDTTSVSVFGEYDKPADLNITHGYSKDHRPDLKQIVVGLGVTPQRIPLLATMENGNASDKTWNMTFINKMRQLLSTEEWVRMMYVADSALITRENLKEMRIDVNFLSRLPDNFTLGKQLKEEAWADNDWQELGVLSDEKDAATYKLQSFFRELDDYLYRFIVVYSSQLDQRKAKSFQKALEKEQSTLEKDFQALHETDYSCQADAEKAWAAFQKDHRSHYFSLEAKVQPEEQRIKRQERGRPKKEETPQTRTVYRIHQTDLTVNRQEIETQKKRLSTFILITNERVDHDDQALLKMYKGQSAAETRFKVLKDPAMLDNIYLKYPHRVEALGFVFVMALLLYGMLEYRIRRALTFEKTPLTLPGNRKSYRPTGQVLLKMLTSIKVLLIEQEDGTKQRILLGNADENARRIVDLAGYSMAIYTEAKKHKLLKRNRQTRDF